MRQWRTDAAWAFALTVAVVALAWAPSELSVVFALTCVPVSYAAGRLMRGLRYGIAAYAIAAVIIVVTSAARSWDKNAAEWITLLVSAFAVSLLPWWIGRYRRLRVEQRRREQREIAERARLLERTRIAQDLHDSLGHDLALIALQAGALELDTTATASQRATAAELRSGAVHATDRLRESLAVLRPEPAPARRQPGPGIEELIERAQRSGLTVDLTRSGQEHHREPWSDSAQQAVARVVQEGLTNAAKYSGGPVTLRIDEPGELINVEVGSTTAEAARAATSRGGGLGLTGLDERLRLLGGTLRTQRDGDRFRLRATIPRGARAGDEVAFEDGTAPDDAVSPSAAAQGRRRHLQAAVLPIAVAVVVGATLFTLHGVTVVRTALAPDDFAQIYLGQRREAIAALLPPHTQRSAPPILVVPEAPGGSTCELYQARASIVDVSQDMYRLCYRDGVLVAKDHLVPRS